MNEIIWNMNYIYENEIEDHRQPPCRLELWSSMEIFRCASGGGDPPDPHQTLKYVASINKYFLLSNISNCRKNISDNLTPHISAV